MDAGYYIVILYCNNPYLIMILCLPDRDGRISLNCFLCPIMNLCLPERKDLDYLNGFL